MISSRSSSAIVFRTKSSTAAIRSSVFSMRVPLGARTYISNAPASTSGKNSRRRSGQSTASVDRQQAEADADRQQAVPQHDVEPP